MTKYAANTEVDASRSRTEIERTLTRYGADGFLWEGDGDQALIAFRMNERQVRFVLTLPDLKSAVFTHYESRGRTCARAPGVAWKVWDQATRQVWRALALVIKAKLEAVEAGISLFEDEFLANTLLPDGQLVGAWLRPQLERAYRTNATPTLLLVAPGR